MKHYVIQWETPEIDSDGVFWFRRVGAWDYPASMDVRKHWLSYCLGKGYKLVKVDLR